jgi:membrane protease YdiL (CAAX protease family)
VKKSPSVVLFVLWTFLLSYGLWAICILGQRLGLFPPGSMWFMPFYLLGGNVPPIVAFFILKRADPELTPKQFLKTAFAVKQKPVYYLLSVLTVALCFVVPAMIGGLDMATPPGLDASGGSGPIPPYLTLIAIPVFFFSGGSEELGWRGVLQPGLEKKMPFLPATCITAVVWTLWHLPLWFIEGTGQSEVDFVRFFITVVGFSFGLAAVRRVSGSVFLCVLIHCALNSLSGSWPVKDELPARALTALVYILFSLAVVFWHKRRGARIAEGS